MTKPIIGSLWTFKVKDSFTNFLALLLSEILVANSFTMLLVFDLQLFSHTRCFFSICSHAHNVVYVCTCMYAWMHAYIIFNQARAGRRPAHTWFLEITFILPKYGVCVHIKYGT